MMYDSSQLHQTTRAFRRRKAAPPCSCDDVIGLVSRHKHLPIRAILHRTHVMLGRTLAEVGEAFGRDRTTVAYACAIVEDLRDDPQFDAEVTSLEQQIEARMEAAEHG